MTLSNLPKDPNRAQSFPLLHLEEQDFQTRADCEPQWINELTSMFDRSAQHP
jgi:hypothetical protein